MARVCLGLLLLFSATFCGAGGWLRFKICPDLKASAMTATGYKVGDVFWVRDSMILNASEHKEYKNCTLISMTNGFQMFVDGEVEDVVCRILIGQECPRPRIFGHPEE